MSNSSGSVERFILGASESVSFETLTPGSNVIALDLHNPLNQGIDGLLTSGGNANAVVRLETSEDYSSFTTLDLDLSSGATDLTVVPGGKQVAKGAPVVGRYCKISNSGTAPVTVVAKFQHRVQRYPNL